MNIELPKDAEGREIPLDTECLYTYKGEKQDVISFTYYRRKDIWEIETDMRTVNSIYLYLTPPDSWKKLEEDLRRGADVLNYEACAYFGKSACDCSSCIADKGETCERVVMRDIADPIRKLRSEN
nr:MAG: hypothetical protein [Bacteriophage sp.]